VDRSSFDLPFASGLSALPVRAYSERVGANALQALWRRKLLILSIMMLAVALGGVAIGILGKRFTSEAIVQLDLSRREGSFGQSDAPGVVLEASSLVQGEARILRSRPMARRVAERLGMLEAVEAIPPGPAALVTEHLRRTGRGAWLGLGLLAAEAGAPDLVPPLPEWLKTPAPVAADPDDVAGAAIAGLLRAVTIGTENRSYLVTIGATAVDPAMAAQIANTFADEYLQWRVRANAEAVTRASDWLTSQVRVTTASLQAAEAEVTAFRLRTGLATAGRGPTGDVEGIRQQQLRELTTQAAAASLARLNEERRFERIQELARTGTLPSAADLQGAPLIAALLDREATAQRELLEMRANFGARHPSVLQAQAGLADVRSRISQEVRRAASLVGNDLAALRSTEAALMAQRDALQQAILAGGEQQTELRNRVEAAEALRERLTSLRRSLESALAAQELPPVTAHLVQPAEADRSSSTSKSTIILGLAAIGGLLIGSILATLLERGDNGLRSGADVKSWLDLRCAGMLPELPRSAVTRPADRRRVAYDEAVYGAGAAVNLLGGGDSRIVLVTSALPGEGKSTFCKALASELVAAGRKVLLINGAAARGGWSETPAGAPAGREAPQGETLPALGSGESLVVLDRRNTFPRAANISGPAGFNSLLAEARKHFDVILIEGAPILLVADSLVLGRLADTVLMVSRWAETPRRVVSAAVRRLQEHAVMVDGVVLSRVDLKRHARLQLIDECSFYLRDRRFYERRARRLQAAGPGSGQEG